MAANEPSGLRICQTNDRSCTLENAHTGVAYRSTYGADTESLHVFVDGTGVLQQPAPLNILELGLGGGTNLLNAFKQFRKWGLREPLIYDAIERAPVSPSILSELHQGTGHREDLALLLDASAQAKNAQHWVHAQHSSLPVTLRVWPDAWQNATLENNRYHAVYQDPFGPKVNPEGWTETWFRRAHAAMTPSAVLTTYSAASAVRRSMAAAGLYRGSRPGAGGKREMTGAARVPESLHAYKLLPASKQPGGIA